MISPAITEGITMHKSVQLSLQISELKGRVNELISKEDRSEAETTELDTKTKQIQEKEVEFRAALVLENTESPTEEKATDGEDREAAEIRARCNVGQYVSAAVSGHTLRGAEKELQEADGVDIGMLGEHAIPFSMFEERAVTPAPTANIGVNLQPIMPAVFSQSIAGNLRVEMPAAESGTYAIGSITTNVTAGAVAADADVPQTAGAITLQSTTPHRVGGSMQIRIEDIAAIGTTNFESAIRQNLMEVMAEALDNQILNGTGSSNQITGLFTALGSAPTNPSATVTFDSALATAAGGIDGLFATNLGQVNLVVGPETYRKFAQVWRDGTQAKGDIAFDAYYANRGGSIVSNARMPDPASNIAQALRIKTGRALRTAVSPTWAGGIGIDDPYSGARAGQRAFTVNALIGDVLVIYSDAYDRIAFKLA